MPDLENKIVWITGGSSGIGRATAAAFAERKCKIVISARSGPELSAAASAIAEHSGNSEVLAVSCDVSRVEEVEKSRQTIQSTWGPVDILVNNAGIGRFSKILDSNEQDWDQMMNINAKGAFLCSKAVLPAMINKKGGHIINVVSVAGIKAFTNCGGYCASKAAMLGFTNVLRLEVREHNIKVTAILPGATETEIWGNAAVDFERMMLPEDVAETIVSLCSSSPRAVAEEIILRPIGGDL